MKQELERLNSVISENSVQISKLASGNSQWEISYNALEEENRLLRDHSRELEAKNKELFLHIDRELTQRAK